MDRYNIPRVAEALTAYAVEWDHGPQRHQPLGAPPWPEQRRFWTDAILQGMARLEGAEPDPQWMERYDRELDEARGQYFIVPATLDVQRDTILSLHRYIAALEGTGQDRRQQVMAVRDLLEDMACHRFWGGMSNGLDAARDTADRALLHMTARMPIRFTRVLLGGERGPCESDFVSGAVTDAEAVRNTELYEKMSWQYQEVTEWPAICTVYVGRGLDSALGTMDASDFDLGIMREAGDRFLDRPGIRPVGMRELKIPAVEQIQVLKVEPGAAPEMVAMPNTLEAFQTAVGGYIEVLGLDSSVCLVCNEEGKLLGLPANRRVEGDTIAGTFLIASVDEGEFRSLSDEDAAHYAEQFAQPMPSYGEQDGPTQWEFFVL